MRLATDPDPLTAIWRNPATETECSYAGPGIAEIDEAPVSTVSQSEPVTPGNRNGQAAPKPQTARENAWPDPISLESPIAPAMPDDVFRYALGEMIYATAEATEAPPDLAANFGLAVVATVVQKTFSIRVTDGHFEPLNTWTMSPMAPGNRKSEVMKRMIRPLADWEKAQAAILLPEIDKAISARKTIEARIARLRTEAAKGGGEAFMRLKDQVAEMEASLPEIPKMRQLYSQDVTPEYAATMLAENGERGSLLSSEGGMFENMGGRYSSGIPNLDVFLMATLATRFAWAAPWANPSICITPRTIGVSPQPQVLAGLTAKKEFRGRGLLGRFLYSVPASRLGCARAMGHQPRRPSRRRTRTSSCP